MCSNRDDSTMTHRLQAPTLHWQSFLAQAHCLFSEKGLPYLCDNTVVCLVMWRHIVLATRCEYRFLPAPFSSAQLVPILARHLVKSLDFKTALVPFQTPSHRCLFTACGRNYLVHLHSEVMRSGDDGSNGYSVIRPLQQHIGV